MIEINIKAVNTSNPPHQRLWRIEVENQNIDSSPSKSIMTLTKTDMPTHARAWRSWMIFRLRNRVSSFITGFMLLDECIEKNVCPHFKSCHMFFYRIIMDFGVFPTITKIGFIGVEYN